jgi:hypothetical protein
MPPAAAPTTFGTPRFGPPTRTPILARAHAPVAPASRARALSARTCTRTCTHRTRTFELVAERSDAFAVFNLCKLAQYATRLPLVPLPLNLLGLPSRIAIELARSCAQGTLFGLHKLLFRVGFSRLVEDDSATVKAQRPVVLAASATRDGRRWSVAAGWTQSNLLANEQAYLKVRECIAEELVESEDAANWRELVARDLAHVRKSQAAFEQRAEEKLTELRALMARAPWNWSKAAQRAAKGEPNSKPKARAEAPF